jgi:hypothetical protein
MGISKRKDFFTEEAQRQRGIDFQQCKTPNLCGEEKNG